LPKEPGEPGDLLPLTPAVMHILLVLADEERHGYGIMKEVEGQTGGEVRLGPGTLYGAIKRMLADKLI
jgi:DNA-binding PadR family transcriptional regulator